MSQSASEQITEQVTTWPDQVEDGKPHPAGYLRAAELLGIPAAHSLVVEDAPAGVEAGRAAGMTVIAVTTTRGESALQSAHSIVANPCALLPAS